MANRSSLNVIALISGGKDSLFSILQCIRHGHKVVALANLHPQPHSYPLASSPSAAASRRGRSSHAGAIYDDKEGEEVEEEEEKEEEERVPDDIDSYMYQTVGHNIIPLYKEALSIPLYRQAISGGASNMDKSYSYHSTTTTTISSSAVAATAAARTNDLDTGEKEEGKEEEDEDETESLMPLLRRVLHHHPDANAVCTGAIFSTYQRTRVESVCERLGLIALAFLWQYPVLPPYTQTSLLEQIGAAGIDARIIKVASGGLDERHLWRNITHKETMKMLHRGMSAFAGGGGGSDSRLASGEILGEGGEFETIVLNGPYPIWKKKIRVEEDGRQIVRGQGGSVAVKVTKAVLEDKTESEIDLEKSWSERLTSLPILDNEFLEILQDPELNGSGPWDRGVEEQGGVNGSNSYEIHPVHVSGHGGAKLSIANISAPSKDSTVEDQMAAIVVDIRTKLAQGGFEPDDIVFTTILLRRMSDFASVNKIYTTLFQRPNPPARVTVSCGDMLPADNTLVMLSAQAEKRANSRMRGLHVQSRSCWAPANIGPYSQAIPSPIHGSTAEQAHEVVYVAGQIPLVPSTMEMWDASFPHQAALALQHLWRIGRDMGVNWWTGSIAFISSCPEHIAKQKAEAAGCVWRLAHRFYKPDVEGEDDLEDEEDIAEKSLRSPWSIFKPGSHLFKMDTPRAQLPAWDKIQHAEVGPYSSAQPPCYVVQVSELPRDAPIEWYSVGVRGNVVLSDSSLSEDRGDAFQMHTCRVKDTDFTVKILAIDAREQYEQIDWQKLISEMDKDVDSACMKRCEIFTRHIPSLEAQMNLKAAVIPCKTIHSGTGKALDAIIRLEIH